MSIRSSVDHFLGRHPQKPTPSPHPSPPFARSTSWLTSPFVANPVLWAWFPLGPAGLRAITLSILCLLLLVLRIAQYHFGARPTPSPFASFVSLTLGRWKLQAAETLASYAFAGWLFSVVYLSSAGGSGGDSSIARDSGRIDGSNTLAWVKHFSQERSRLNERPIFLTCHLVLLGLLQGLRHLARDADRLSLTAVVPPERQQGTGKNGPGSSTTRALAGAANPAVTGPGSASVFRVLAASSPRFLHRAILDSLVGLAWGVIWYRVALRNVVWAWTAWLLRPFYGLPKAGAGGNLPPSSGPPFSVPMLARALWSGFLLTLLWTTCDACFALFMARDPLKGGKELTAESKDPNGSLLNGLKSRKLNIKVSRDSPAIDGTRHADALGTQCFAMWELAFIATNVEARRKALFEDIDRKEGPVWSQVYAICLDVVKGIESRIDSYGKEPPAKQLADAPSTFNPRDGLAVGPKNADVVRPKPLPDKPIRNEVEKVVGKMVRSPGQTPIASISPGAKKALGGAMDYLLTKEQQQTLSPSSLKGQIRAQLLRILESPAGVPFRQPFRRRIAIVVLGGGQQYPYAELSLHVNAITVLGQLACRSLTEDRFGNVQRDVAQVIRTFTTVIGKLDAFVKAFPMHWTDVEARRESPEADEILDAMRCALREMVAEFGPYSDDLRLSLRDMRLAREAAGWDENDKKGGHGRQEMQQVR